MTFTSDDIIRAPSPPPKKKTKKTVNQVRFCDSLILCACFCGCRQRAVVHADAGLRGDLRTGQGRERGSARRTEDGGEALSGHGSL